MEIGVDFDDHECGKCSGKGCSYCHETGRTGNMEHLDKALQYLRNRYGNEAILIRKSSSGDGFHVRVIVDILPDEEMKLRADIHDCIGRQIADIGRMKAGLRTSRLFDVKSRVNVKTGELLKHRRCGRWKHGR